jgi:exosortase/archaeosortase
MASKNQRLRASRRLALVAGIVASIFLKLTIEKVIELWTVGTLPTPSIYVLVCCCALGLISLFVAFEKAG